MRLWVHAEGSDSVAEAESAILESLSSHVRTVVATLGGSHGAAGRTDKWRHLYSGFSNWLSQTEALEYIPCNIILAGKLVFSNYAPNTCGTLGMLHGLNAHEDSAKEEVRRHIEDGSVGYPNADVVVKLQVWDADHSNSVAQASLSDLKRLILSDKKLPGKKSLYLRSGCRVDWPNNKPPVWDPSTATDAPPPSTLPN
ncbi:putative inactive shikimate kinase like 2 [Hibiscus syriacus]|uniref:Inactive shikimate kinase like 2 n=1 Tax=Hibiscus syriacus TaxID=106335 RepID=A0A6A3AKW7_HIBSY|nr:putative inactive shikimate kinase like 2 [Hibiscus syriacus]